MTAWWDIDTYKVATVKNSSSRMHKITSRPLTINDFSYDDKNGKIESLLVNGNFVDMAHAGAWTSKYGGGENKT